jgi:hypothetical protein
MTEIGRDEMNAPHSKDIIAKATAALAESVGSIIASGGDGQAEALARTFAEAEAFLMKNLAGAGGETEVGFAKSEKETPPMTSLEDIAKSHGVAGVVEIAKNITDAEKSYGLTEEGFVKLIDTAARVAHPELGALAFEKVYERNPVLAKAVAVIKAWPSPMALTPTMVGGTDALLEVSDDTPSAYEKLLEMAERQRRAGETASRAFERVYLDPANRHLAEAERAQNRPRPTTNYPFPR